MTNRVKGPIVLAVVATLIVLVALLTPEQQQARGGDQRLTTRSTGSNNASLLYDLAGRLGWRVSRRYADTLGTTGPRAIHAVLWPVTDVRMTEAHALLEHVRRGGALLYVVGEGGALEDSLHVAHGTGGSAALGPGAGLGSISIDPDDEMEHTADCANVRPDRTAGLPMWVGQEMLLYSLVWRRPPPPDRVTFMTMVRRPLGTSDGARRVEPAAVGFPYGQGRIVVVSDPDVLRNDVLRRCGWRADVVAIRMLEYLSAGTTDGVRRDRLVFDEYHQGFGDQPGTMRAIGRYLAVTPSGHTVLQLGLAGLVLLAALAPRLLPPRDPERIERRSPLEHVDALARAYQRVGATRTATAQLLHGVRRRTERLSRGAGADRSDDLFLDWAARRVPDRADDIAVIRGALAMTRGGASLTPMAAGGASLTLVGDALQRLERSLLTSRQ